MPTSGDASDDKVGIMTSRGFSDRLSLYCGQTHQIIPLRHCLAHKASECVDIVNTTIVF